MPKDEADDPDDDEKEEAVVEKKVEKVGHKVKKPAAPAAPTAEPCVAEPAPLGLLGLAVAAVVLMSADMGFSEAKPSLMLPWTLMLGATAQLIAGIMDFQRKNVFGATVFTGFSLLWYGLSATWIIILWGGVSTDPTHLTFAFIGYLVFGLYCTVASLGTNKILFIIMVFIDLAVGLLVAKEWYTFDANYTGAMLLCVAVFSFYGSFAVLINQMAKRTVFPMGAPIIKFS
jgi:hypothetical protein